MSRPISVGAFGKLPSHGDFVSFGMASATAKSFDKFCQMANDRVVQAENLLPIGPIGFCFRDAECGSLLLGVMVASKDSAGRRFPFAVFCELPLEGGLPLAGAPSVFTPSIVELNRLALDARQTTPAVLKKALSEVNLPDQVGLGQAMRAEIARLDEVPLARLLRRIFKDRPGACLAASCLLRSCDNALREGPKRQTTVDLRVTSDMELLFWLACSHKRVAHKLTTVSSFWDVQEQRALIVPGVPDSNTLNFLTHPDVNHNKLWNGGRGMVQPPVEAKAAAGLATKLSDMLTDPKSATASDFIQALGERD